MTKAQPDADAGATARRASRTGDDCRDVRATGYIDRRAAVRLVLEVLAIAGGGFVICLFQ